MTPITGSTNATAHSSRNNFNHQMAGASAFAPGALARDTASE